MYDEKEREDHLSLDFHTGIAPDMQFRMKVNLIALLMFLQGPRKNKEVKE